MKTMTERGARVRGVLQDVLKRIDPDQRLKAFETWTFWNDIVGETLARRAQPTGYRNGVLFVTVKAHAWLQELQFMKDTLRDRLNARLGEPMIRDIYFVSGSLEFEPGSEQAAGHADSIDHAPPREIVLPEIQDAELANAFQRVVQAHTQRKLRRLDGQRRSKSR
jgi:hypothetical protein